MVNDGNKVVNHENIGASIHVDTQKWKVCKEKNMKVDDLRVPLLMENILDF